MADKRLLSDWLQGYLDFTSRQESPESIHLWTAMTMISAASRRNVFIAHEYYKIFPNIYVIIVAMSARVRKSTAMNIGRDILLDAVPDIKIMRDSMTAQGLIHSLNHKMTVIKKDKLVEEQRSDVFIHADEVANLFGYDKTRAAQMVIFLTRTYESPDVYDHTTVRDRTVRLYNLYPVFIGGTDPSNLKVLPEEAIGGLTGRLIWLVEKERRSNDSGWKRSTPDSIQRQLIREYLVHDLKRISNLAGEMVVKPEAQEYYDDWYEELSKMDSQDPETDAFYNRCHTTALRVAMLKSLAEGDSMEISLKHMRSGIYLIQQNLPEYKRVTMWKGHSLFEQQRARYISFLQQSGGLATRRNVLKHMGVNAETFDQITATLFQDGTIEKPVQIKNEIVIKLR